jgi:hypothetical protein
MICSFDISCFSQVDVVPSLYEALPIFRTAMNLAARIDNMKRRRLAYFFEALALETKEELP